MPAKLSPLDAMLRGLADPTRRAVVDDLASGPMTVSALAEPHGMALPSFVQHLAILEEAGLVTSDKVGRVRTCRLRPQALAALERWAAQRQATWAKTAQKFDADVKALRTALNASKGKTTKKRGKKKK